MYYCVASPTDGFVTTVVTFFIIDSWYGNIGSIAADIEYIPIKEYCKAPVYPQDQEKWTYEKSRTVGKTSTS